MATAPTSQPREITLSDVKKKLAGTGIESNATIHADIVRLCNRYWKEKKRPLYTYCIVTGERCAMTAIDYFSKRLALFGEDLFRLMTEYIGRSGKKERPATNSGGTTGKKSNSVLDKTGDNDPNQTPRAKRNSITIKAGFEEYSSIQHENPATGEVLIRRYEIAIDGNVMCQWDEFSGTEKKPDMFYTGDPTLRTELRSRASAKS